MTFEDKPLGNLEELKHMLMDQMEESGAMSDLRALVKSHVVSAMSDTLKPSTSLQLKTESTAGLMLALCLDFLDHYGLSRTIQVLEAEVSHLAPFGNRGYIQNQHPHITSFSSEDCAMKTIVTHALSSPEKVSNLSDSIEADIARLRSLNAEIDEEADLDFTISKNFDFSPAARFEDHSIEEHFEPLSSHSSDL